MDIKAIANSTNMTTLCSSVRFSSCDNKTEREREGTKVTLVGFWAFHYARILLFRFSHLLA